MKSAAWLAVAGMAQALSLAWPWGGTSLPGLQIVAMALMCHQLMQLGRPQSVFKQAWWFATVWLTATFWWLFISLHTYGGMPAALAALSVSLLAGALAIYYAIAAWLVVSVRHHPSTNLLLKAKTAAAFASAWTLAEMGRALIFTGFPWGAVGYAHVDGLLSLLSPWLGVYGVGWLAAFGAMGAAMAWQSLKQDPNKHPLKWVFVGLTVLWVQVPPPLTSAPDEPQVPVMQVHLLQGNIPQSEKFQANTGIAQALSWYRQELTKVHSGLAIAPETALPLLPQHLPAGYWQGLREHFSNGTSAALIGVPWVETGPAGLPLYSNSIIGWQPGQAQDYRYDKDHLVPFGEFVPPMFRWFTAWLDMPMSDFKAGGQHPATFDWQGNRIAPHICYEDLFGEELAQGFIDPLRAPTVLVNISNIAWFGDSIAIDQHLNIARMRSLEFQRPMVRATNTGMTAVIDHRGQVTAQLPRHHTGVLSTTVQGRNTAPTFFAQWAARWGLWPLISICALIVGWFGWHCRKSTLAGA
ncbi:MAG: apolipoprotein N-acyltransferase [Betaproteobacteria bacterium]|nr:apolipoprotein N-acyltransferase [Betaproteobacteria bacterium]